MGFRDGTFGDGFSEGRWSSKAIPIMNELVQMARGPVPYVVSRPRLPDRNLGCLGKHAPKVEIAPLALNLVLDFEGKNGDRGTTIWAGKIALSTAVAAGRGYDL